MSKSTSPTYKATNWKAYNRVLVSPGSLLVHLDTSMTWYAVPRDKRGRAQTYSDAAIQFCLTIKCLFGLALRQSIGFVQSLLK